jgi:protoporphyrinogen oxidase
MPLKEHVEGMNGVPEDVKSIAQGLPYRDFVTVGVLVDRLNLQNKTNIKTLNNIIPDNWIYVQDTGVKLGRIQVFNNWSPYLVKDPEHTVWIGLEYFCTENDNYWNMSKEEWLSFATEELVCMHVLDDAKAVKDYHVEFVKKAYPAYFDTYAQIDKLVAWLNKIDNLYCVGRNGQHRYNNMDHSMATSFETVSNILSGRKDKSNIWSVNTEKEYHESK